MNTFIRIFILSLFIILCLAYGSKDIYADWNMSGADPQRTSWINQEPSVEGIEWYRPIEAYIDQKIQIVVGNKHAYIATTKGLIVLDAESGSLAWRFDTEMPIGQSPTIIGDMVYFGGMDRKVYAIKDLGNSYNLEWEFVADSGFSANPIVIGNSVYIGSRGGFFYSLNRVDGSQQWKYPNNSGLSPIGSILISPAYDQTDNALYFVAADQYAYALNASNGNLIWKSAEKLAGERYVSWWPVIYNNYIVFSSSQAMRNGMDPGTKNIPVNGVPANSDMKRVFRNTFFKDGHGKSGNIINSDGNQGWPNNLSLLDTESNAESGGMTLQRWIEDYSYLKSYVVLNRSNGREDILMPYSYTQTYSGTVYPPIVNPNTNALYAKNLFSGSNSVIDRGNYMGWKPGNRYLHLIEGSNTWAIDEPQGYAGAGNSVYFNLCCDRASGNLSGSKWWNYGTGTLEMILPALNDPNSYDVMWQKYGNALERLQAYYNGQTNSRNGVYNSHGLQNPPIPYVFTNSSGQTINRFFMHRSNAVIALGRDVKRSLPILEVNNNPPHLAVSYTPTEVTRRLESEIDKIIDVYDQNSDKKFLSPGYYNHGNNLPLRISESKNDNTSLLNNYFIDPAVGLITLSDAYQYISDVNLKNRLKIYLQNYYNRYFGDQTISSIGWNNYPRENIIIPQPISQSMINKGDVVGHISQLGFYGLWKYAELFPDQAINIYNKYKNDLLPATHLNVIESPHINNKYIAAYQGFLNLQKLAFNGNYPVYEQTKRNNIQAELDSLLTDRVNSFAKDHPWLGENDNPNGIRINNYTRRFNLARNFLFLTPELGQYMRDHNFSKINDAINEYKYLGAFWFDGFNQNSFQEDIKQHLHDRPALFLASAYIQQLSFDQLSKYIDIPTFDRGDWYYIQDLIAVLRSSNEPVEPPPIQCNGDFNNSNSVNIEDLLSILNNWGEYNIQDLLNVLQNWGNNC